jgi:DNA-binding response OmpR family regulator
MGTAGSKGTILFADDDEEIQLLMRRVAEKHGYDVIQAFDGEEAQRLILEHHPDLIVLDIMMPKLDGRDLCQRLKSDPVTQQIPVIIFSARGEQSDRLVGLALGADDYIDKPFNLDLLLNKIRHHLWKRQPPVDPKP